jgi:hypothetical protein
MNKGKRVVMSESFMTKTYYYPSDDDNRNSINGAIVIDFKNYSLDKKQKLQRGGAPDASICSDENAGHFGVGHLGHLDNVPIQTFAAVCDALYLSASIDYFATANANQVSANVALVAANAALVAANAAAAAAAATAAASAAAAAAPAAAAAAAAAATADANALAAANTAAAAAANTAAIMRDEHAAAQHSFQLATDARAAAETQLAETISGMVRPNPRPVPVTQAQRRTALTAVGGNNSAVIWTTFADNIASWISNNTRNKLISFVCASDMVIINITEVISTPAVIQIPPNNSNCWRIAGQLLQSDVAHATIHGPEFTDRRHHGYRRGPATIAPQGLSSHVWAQPPPPAGVRDGRSVAGAFHIQRERVSRLELGSKWQLCYTYDCTNGPNINPANCAFQLNCTESDVLVNPGDWLARRRRFDPIVPFFTRLMSFLAQEFIRVSNTPSLRPHVLNNNLLDATLRTDLTRPGHQLRLLNNCRLKGAAWPTYFTRASISLNSLCMVTDADANTTYPAWVSGKSPHPTNSVNVQPMAQAYAMNPASKAVVIAERGLPGLLTGRAVAVREPTAQELADHFPLVNILPGTPCMSMVLNADGYNYAAPIWTYAIVTGTYNPDLRIFDVQIFPRGRAQDQTVSAYAIRPCTPVELNSQPKELIAAVAEAKKKAADLMALSVEAPVFSPGAGAAAAAPPGPLPSTLSSLSAAAPASAGAAAAAAPAAKKTKKGRGTPVAVVFGNP